MQEIKCPSCESSNVEQIDTDKYQCPYCGRTFTSQEVNPQPSTFNNISNDSSEVDDNPGCLMNGLCFLIPLVGFILYFVKKEELPNCAKSYLTWAAIGVAIGVAINILGVWD